MATETQRQHVSIALMAFVLGISLNCTPQKDLPRVGSEGGSVPASDDSQVTLVVPEGALRDPTPLAVRAIPGRLPGAVGPAVEATPHGAVFEKPVALRFKLSPRDLAPGVHFSEARVATLQNGTWKIIPTRFPSPGIVEGLTTHFSTFAIVAPCHVAGDGTDFPLSACPNINPRIQTTFPVSLEAKGASITLAMTIRPTPTPGPVNFTISGLTPSWTYHLSRDASSLLIPLTASASGTLSFTQDVASAHSLMLMAQHGSITLSASTCSQVGTWTGDTCILSTDISSPPIYIGDDDLRLDCAGHTIGGAGRASVGVYFTGRQGVTIQHCTISNVDFGIVAGGTGLTFSDIAISTPKNSAAGTTAFDLSQAADVAVSDSRITAFNNGLASYGGADIGSGNYSGANISVSRTTFQVLGLAALLTNTDGATMDNVVIDGNLGGSGAEAILVSLNGGGAVPVIRNLATTGPMSGYGAVISTVESGVTVQGANISRAAIGIQLGPAGYNPSEASLITDSTFSSCQVGLELNGPNSRVFHNNFFSSGSPAVVTGVLRPGAKPLQVIELSDVDPNSSTFQEGNYWGHGCPGPLFAAGVDTGDAGVIDSYPYAKESAWTSGFTPGTCVPDAPTFTSPDFGSFVTQLQPLLTGRTTGGATVEVTEGSTVLGQAKATPNGAFSLTPSTRLAEGAHSVTAVSHLNGVTSLSSAPLHFIVDTVAPAAPKILLPTSGQQVGRIVAFVSGSVEAGARVTVFEAGAPLAVVDSTSDGGFSCEVILSAGTHSLVATAHDSAGNASAPSTAVTVNVSEASASAPLLGAIGKLQVTSLRDSPTPLFPSRGQPNVVSIQAVLNHGTGAHAAQRYDAVLDRLITDAAGAVVRHISTQTPLVPSTAGTSPISIAAAWDGLNNLGAPVPSGNYVSTVALVVVRNKSPGASGTTPPDCQSPSFAGPCVVDRFSSSTLEQIINAFEDAQTTQFDDRILGPGWTVDGLPPKRSNYLETPFYTLMNSDELWGHVRLCNQALLVGLKRAGLNRGEFRGQVLVTDAEYSEFRRMVASIPGVTDITDKYPAAAPGTTLSGAKLPWIHVVAANQRAMDAVRGMANVDFVEPACAVDANLMGSSGCGTPTMKDPLGVPNGAFREQSIRLPEGDIFAWTFLELNVIDAWHRLAEVGQQPGTGVTIADVGTGISNSQHQFSTEFLASKGISPASDFILPFFNANDTCDHGTRMAGYETAPLDGRSTVGIAFNSGLFVEKIADGVVLIPPGLPDPFSSPVLPLVSMIYWSNIAGGLRNAAARPSQVLTAAWGTAYASSAVESAIVDIHSNSETAIIAAAGTNSPFNAPIFPATMHPLVIVASAVAPTRGFPDTGYQKLPFNPLPALWPPLPHAPVRYGPEVDFVGIVALDNAGGPTTGLQDAEVIDLGGSSGATAEIGGLYALAWASWTSSRPPRNRDNTILQLQTGARLDAIDGVTSLDGRSLEVGWGIPDARAVVGGLAGVTIAGDDNASAPTQVRLEARPIGDGNFSYKWDAPCQPTGAIPCDQKAIQVLAPVSGSRATYTVTVTETTSRSQFSRVAHHVISAVPSHERILYATTLVSGAGFLVWGNRLDVLVNGHQSLKTGCQVKSVSAVEYVHPGAANQQIIQWGVDQTTVDYKGDHGFTIARHPGTQAGVDVHIWYSANSEVHVRPAYHLLEADNVDCLGDGLQDAP